MIRPSPPASWAPSQITLRFLRRILHLTPKPPSRCCSLLHHVPRSFNAPRRSFTTGMEETKSAMASKMGERVALDMAANRTKKKESIVKGAKPARDPLLPPGTPESSRRTPLRVLTRRQPSSLKPDIIPATLLPEVSPRPLAPRRGFDPGEAWLRDFGRIVKNKEFKEALRTWAQAGTQGIEARWIHNAAVLLMKALLDERQPEQVPRIYALMVNDFRTTSTHALNYALRAHLMVGNLMKFAVLYRTRPKNVEPDPITYDLLVQALVQARRLDQARDLILSLLDKGLKPTSLSIYLTGVQRQGYSLDELTKEYNWVLSLRPAGGKHSIGVYRAMMEGCFEYGNFEAAKRVVADMESCGYSSEGVAYESLLVVQAQEGRWSAVAKTLKKMSLAGIKLHTRMLNLVLDLYSVNTEMDSVEQLLLLLRQSGAIPSTTTYNILIAGYMRANSRKEAYNALNRMLQDGLRPDFETAMAIFDRFRLKNRVSKRQFQRLKMLPDLRPYLTSLVQPNHVAHVKGVPFRNKSLYRTELEASTEAEINMKSAIDRHNFIEAAEHFRGLIELGFRPSQAAVRLALVACVVLQDKHRADLQELLRIANKRGCNVKIRALDLLADFSHNRSGPFETTIENVLTAYRFMITQSVPISHKVAVRIASRLLTSGDSEGAVNLIRDIYRLEWGDKVVMQIGGLTVMLRAYLALQEHQAVDWVVEQLVKNQVVPSRTFMWLLEEANKMAIFDGSLSQQRRYTSICIRLRRHKIELSRQRTEGLMAILIDKAPLPLEVKGLEAIRKVAEKEESVWTRKALELRS